jgi:hypothetical protein
MRHLLITFEGIAAKHPILKLELTEFEGEGLPEFEEGLPGF